MAKPKNRPKSNQKHKGKSKHFRGRSPKRSGKRDQKEFKSKNVNKLMATIDKNPRGFAFVIFNEPGYDDVFLNKRYAADFFNGDRVLVTVSKDKEIVDIELKEHRFRTLAGRFMPNISEGRGERQPGSGFVISDTRKMRQEIFIPKTDKPIKDGDWVWVKVNFPEKNKKGRRQSGGQLTGEILKHFGENLPASSDIEIVAGEFNLIEKHSIAAIKEAESFKLDLSEKALKKRTDFRKTPFITIDGETARDFDDAIYVERTKAGFTLWVAIADVSHYVKEGSALDKEALARGTSVYFPERAFHMLPSELSENLCSLRPDEPRFTMVAKIEFNKAGKKKRTSLYEGLIQSKRRATYKEIENERKENLKNGSWEFRPHFDLYALLRKQRTVRGSIDFDFPEAYIKVDEVGEPVSIEIQERYDSHRLIEEFMIAANEAVTEWIMQKTLPFIYRIHEEPSFEKLETFQTLAKTVGIDFSPEAATSHPKVIAKLVQEIEGHRAHTLLNMLLLRSMKQARYSSDHNIHYGLASEAYTHFTSPIRRYPDLCVHRMLRMAIRLEQSKKKLSKKEKNELDDKLEEVSQHCSQRERIAAEADREATRIKQVRYMHRHLGDEFDGTIIGMNKKGIFVQIEDPYCEGMIPVDTMTDDYYLFNEDLMLYYGRRSKKTFKMGDKIPIQVTRASIEKREVEFAYRQK